MSHHDEELSAVLTRMALAGDGVVLGMGLAVLAVRTWLKFCTHSKALKQVRETPVSRISDLRSLVQQKNETDCREIPKSTPDSLAGSDLSTFVVKPPTKPIAKVGAKLVIVRGRVYTTAALESTEKNPEHVEALVSQTGNEKGVYVERTQTYMHTEMNSLLGWITQKDLITLTRRMCLYNESRGIFGWGFERKSLLGWGSHKEQVTVSRQKVPFVLAGSDVHFDSSQPKVCVHVQLDDPPKQPLPLVTVYHKLHPVPASSYTFFQAMFGRRYPVGLLDEEKILPVGKEITAVGVIGASTDGNAIIYSCKHLPCFLVEGTREQLITELATGTKLLMWTGIAMSTIAVGILGYSFVKNWTKYKARQRDRQRRDEETRQDRLLVEYELEDITDVPDGELCIVCLLRRRRAAFIFCGHRVCCVSCAQRVEQGVNPRCPVCRQSVTGYVRVFDS